MNQMHKQPYDSASSECGLGPIFAPLQHPFGHPLGCAALCYWVLGSSPPAIVRASLRHAKKRPQDRSRLLKARQAYGDEKNGRRATAGVLGVNRASRGQSNPVKANQVQTSNSQKGRFCEARTGTSTAASILAYAIENKALAYRYDNPSFREEAASLCYAGLKPVKGGTRRHKAAQGRIFLPEALEAT